MKKSRESNGKKVSFGERVRDFFGCTHKDVIDRTPIQGGMEVHNPLQANQVGNGRISLDSLNYQGLPKAYIHQGLPYDITKVVPGKYSSPLPPTSPNSKVLFTEADIVMEIQRDYIRFTQVTESRLLMPKTNVNHEAKKIKHGPYRDKLVGLGKQSGGYAEQAIHLNRGRDGKFYRVR